MNLANKLTIFRMILVPVLVIISLLPTNTSILGIPITFIIMEIIFIIASITDKLDGYIARSRNQITTFGKFLDPIADKILVITALIILVEQARLPAWIPIIIVTREFLISGYRLVAIDKNGKVISANMWGKLKTVTQMLAIILAIIDINPYGAFIHKNLHGFALGINTLSSILMTISVIATILSGYSYMKNSKELLKN